MFGDKQMAKSRMMGKQYQIVMKGDWEDVAQAVRETKGLLRGAVQSASRSRGFFNLASSYGNDLALKALNAYIEPNEGESFADYRMRFIEAFTNNGFQKGLLRLFSMGKVPFGFNVRTTVNDTLTGVLEMSSVTRKDKFSLDIGVAGKYLSVGSSVASGLQLHSEGTPIGYGGRTLDKLV
jgi:hypothetical protein